MPSVGLGLRLVFRVFFFFSFTFFVLVLFSFVVLDLVSLVLCQKIGWKNVSELTIFWRVGCESLTHSINFGLFLLHLL